MNTFSCPTKIICGTGAVEALRSYAAGKAMVVTDGFFTGSGDAARVAALAAPEYEIFDRVEPDPPLELVARATAQMKAFGPQVLVALGGGSVMDTAKAMRHFSGKKLPLVAIPTTSGSGSEVTDFAILTHQGVKHPLVDPGLAPDAAILDDDFLKKLPKSLIADAGYDVLAHALEAIAATGATPITTALAKDAFAAALGALPASYAGNAGVRMTVHVASTMAAMAFNQAGLGICHALSHALGGRFHVPHGRLNAILLPEVVMANVPGAGVQYASLARWAGLGGSADTVAIRNLKNALVRLRRELHLPATLQEAGVDPRQLRRCTEEILDAALADSCCRTNPVAADRVLLRQVLWEVAGCG